MTTDTDPATPASILLPGPPGYRRVATRLRQDIIDGAISPGDWLRLQSVADMCGVSVQPVREAMQLLEGEGLVQIFPNRGAQVRGIDRQRIEHIYDIREAVESMLVRRFCELATMADILRVEELQAVHDECSGRMDGHATSTANFAFHHYINSRVGNSEALALVERYQELGLSLHRRFPGNQARFDRVRIEHNMLLDAFRGRDPEAASMISKMHVRGTRRDLLNHIEALDPTHMPPGFGGATQKRLSTR